MVIKWVIWFLTPPNVKLQYNTRGYCIKKTPTFDGGFIFMGLGIILNFFDFSFEKICRPLFDFLGVKYILEYF